MRKAIDEKCCACGDSFSCHYDGKPYCNKHYLRMRNNGSVDVVDETVVRKYSWCVSKTGYAVANIKGKVTKMHRNLLGSDCDRMTVDHKNNDPLDNRRRNLRVCSQQENARNKTVEKNCSSGHLGIRVTLAGTYQARITHCRKEIQLGTYNRLEEAIQARNEAEDRYYGEFGNHRK